MSRHFDSHKLDVRAFAQEAGRIEGRMPLSELARLAQETTPGAAMDGYEVTWSAQGEARERTGGADQVWLHLQAGARLPMICQRCMNPVAVELKVDRSFRFVRDEETAAQEDEEADEDVLVLSRGFDLLELVEDELLMELPAVPRHDACPVEVRMAYEDAQAEAPAHPFALLGRLRGPTSG